MKVGLERERTLGLEPENCAVAKGRQVYEAIGYASLAGGVVWKRPKYLDRLNIESEFVKRDGRRLDLRRD